MVVERQTLRITLNEPKPAPITHEVGLIENLNAVIRLSRYLD